MGRSVVVLLTIAMGTAAVAGSSPAHAQAQMSEADRKSSARILFGQGIKAQEAGHYDVALPLFERAQRVYEAPTHLLHIAECQAMLGKLVDAAETYEILKRTPLSAGAPEAFVQSKEQGAAELAAVRARIPTMRIDITPAPAQLHNLQVTVNDVQLPVELLGVARPVNPGPYRIVARADGYGPTSMEANIKEREPRTIALSLDRNASPLPPPVPPPLPGARPQPAPFNPNPSDPNAYQPPPPRPPLSSAGIGVGLHLGGLGMFQNGNGTTGFAGGPDFYLRFAKVILIGATVQVASLNESTEVEGRQTSFSVNKAKTTWFTAGRLSFLTHPERFAFTLGMLGGMRKVEGTEAAGTVGGTLGFFIPVGNHIKLEPRLDVTTARVGNDWSPFVFFGLAGYFNHNFVSTKPQ